MLFDPEWVLASVLPQPLHGAAAIALELIHRLPEAPLTLTAVWLEPNTCEVSSRGSESSQLTCPIGFWGWKIRGTQSQPRAWKRGCL